MARTTTELPTSPAGSKSKTGNDHLEAEAIGLDVAVRVHGSQVAAVVLESTEHVEPFEEDTTTMVVFPRGAVVKLRARVRAGHAMVLTNLLTKQTALCRVIQVNTAPNVAHYVKLEFAQPTLGFWGVHFPSDPLPSARNEEASKTASAVPIKTAVEPALLSKPAPVSQVAPPTIPIAPEIQTPRVEAPPALTAKPSIRETIKSTPPRELTLTVPATEYGNERHGETEDLVPLASGSPSADRKTLSASRVPAIVPARPKRDNSSATEQPIFDSLTTQEDVFPRETTAANIGEKYQPEPARQLHAGASRNTITAVDYSSLLQPAATSKPRSSALISAGAVVVLLAFVAGGAMYLRRNSTRAAQITSPTPASTSFRSSSSPSSSRRSAPNAGVVLTNPDLSVPTTSSAEPSSQVQRNADIPVAAPPIQRSLITTDSGHVPQKNAAATSRPTISTGTANIYAGDLSSHAQIKPPVVPRISAPVPDVNDPGSQEIPVTPNGNLGSLVPGVGSSNLIAPAPPKPEVVEGGNVKLPKLISSVAPIYPQLATMNHVEGEVKIQTEINALGKVTSTKVISGPVLLRSAATNAVRQWKYSPGMLDGKAVPAQYVVTVRFRLNQ